MDHCLEAGREIDLGGIGKGFALDAMRGLLEDWGIKAALLSAGASTQLAFGEHAWPIELIGDKEQRRISLQNEALSASGTGIQGSHIIPPGGNPENLPFERVWVIRNTAALADAWSTALILMDPNPAVLNQKDLTCFVESSVGTILNLAQHEHRHH